MVINDLVYIHGFYHRPELSFLKFPNRTKLIRECETIVVSPYGFNADLYKSEMLNFIEMGFKMIIDASTEIIGKQTIDFALDLEDTSVITIYTNTFESEFKNDIDKIRNGGGEVIVLPFFIKYMNQYTPKYTNIELKNRDFLFLSGKSKPPRTAMVGLLSYYDLIDKGYVSFFGDGVEDNKSNFFYDKTSHFFDRSHSTEIQKNKVREGLSKIPNKLVLDVEDLTHEVSHTRNYNGDYYKSANFVIVVESDMREGLFFITEKTTKCIQQNKKFILFGPSGCLDNLKRTVKEELGQDISHLTDWCDTSYDDITNVWDRLDEIVRVIKYQTLKTV